MNVELLDQYYLSIQMWLGNCAPFIALVLFNRSYQVNGVTLEIKGVFIEFFTLFT